MAGIEIIVPVLNEEAILPEQLHRLKAISDAHLLFVDGGSSDRSTQLLDRAGVCWISSKPGRAGQMNAGARHCNSDVLVFLHADTVFEPRHLQAIRQVMQNEEIVAGRFDIHLSGSHPAFRLIEFMINLRSRLTKISTGDQAMFVRHSAFEAAGGFPEQPLMEDIEISKRLRQLGEIACLGERVMTSSRRWEVHGIARTVWLMWWLRLRYWLGADPDALKKHYLDQT
ncbi:MAG: TIGR04283 family arsenosugar biosynthesis glycosyltransferase [Mariprofundaceae bacterium]